MKTNSWLALALTLFPFCARAQIEVSPTAVNTVVVDRGPDHVVLQNVRTSVDTFGQTVAETNSYVQLTPGLSWFNPQTQQWEETKEHCKGVIKGSGRTIDSFQKRVSPHF